MTTSLERVQSALAPRYLVRRELGAGGMAMVYLAEDSRHGRPVAVKVLRPELAAAVGPERFLREIRTAARLQHPHILPLHDSGEAAGLLWYAMPYVEGESLRARLTRETQLPLEDALHVARDVAGALAYAHQHGVIHRDIKPENILLEAGEAVVADFGIARAIDSAGGAKLTETGLALGTPAYMSPEQAMGSEVDGRSDVYALGCVLYEMLAGEPPHTGPTAQAIITRRFTETPRPLRTMRELVPEAVEQAVVTALAKSPADRFQTVAEFARALATPSISVPAPAVLTLRQRLPWPSARLVVIGAAVLGLLALGGLVARSLRLGSHAASPKMLAVLPFENLGRSEDEYFADGLTEEITSRLAGLRDLGVISRTSSMQYKRTTKPLKQIGRELGVGYVLEGSVRWEKLPDGKSRVRVTPQLIEVSDDRHMWASRYDADLADIFQVQGQIAEQVTSALDLALLAPERKALAAKPTESLEAYDAFLRANELFYEAGDLPTFRRAAEQYDRAVALDSAFAPAWAGVSRAYSVLYNYSSVGREADRRRAYTAAERALGLDPALVDGHLALVRYYGYTRYDWPRALEEYTKARERAPHSPEVVKIGAVALARSGRFEPAIEHTRDAERLDPRSYALPTNRAAYLLVLRRYPEALAAADRAIALGPSAADIY
jgi:serine/threonine-protein kinase